MSNDFYVYGYYEIDSANQETIFYVGKGRGGRMWEHFKFTEITRTDMFHSKLRSMVAKDSRIIVKIIKDNLTEDEAFKLEIELIELYGRRDLETGDLTNQSVGGSGRSGFIASDETREKIRQAKLGHIQSEETIEKRVEKNRGKKRSKEIRAKMVKSHSHRGQPIESFNLETGKIIKKYVSINQTNIEDRYNTGIIWEVLRGKRQHAYSMGWRYQPIETITSESIDPNSFSMQPFENFEYSETQTIIPQNTQTKPNPRSHPIESYDLITGITVKKYDSISQVREDGYDTRNIKKVLKKIYSQAHGFGWKYTP